MAKWRLGPTQRLAALALSTIVAVVLGVAFALSPASLGRGHVDLDSASGTPIPADAASHRGGGHVPLPGASATARPHPKATAPAATPGPPDGPVVVLQPGQAPGGVTVCGTQLCSGGSPIQLDGASIYNPGLRPEQSGYLNPAGTIQLAQEAHLNTLRIINFYTKHGDPATVPYLESNWVLVDRMIAAAGAAGMHVDLGLGDYRNILWESCIDPYTADWTHFVDFVANRRNTVTGALYKDDPTIAFVSIAGEPLQANKPHTGVNATGSPDPNLANCTVEYTTQQLTDFYINTENAWAATGASVMINTGGLGYINESDSGIDWKTIYALPHNPFCAFKTYGGMFAFAPTVAAYCHSIGKPVLDEEFGYEQSNGDAQRATEFANQYSEMRSIGAAGVFFWNLGYQVASTSYEVSPLTPLTFAAVQAANP
ncbi:MAG: hypothetical protein JOY68_01610 [Candidatus Dormibacteraeota bacterium]|nr:hypothetical protein [Candidatus Dormibacteraeota bacterium]